MRIEFRDKIYSALFKQFILMTKTRQVSAFNVGASLTLLFFGVGGFGQRGARLNNKVVVFGRLGPSLPASRLLHKKYKPTRTETHYGRSQTLHQDLERADGATS